VKLEETCSSDWNMGIPRDKYEGLEVAVEEMSTPYHYIEEFVIGQVREADRSIALCPSHTTESVFLSYDKGVVREIGWKMSFLFT
jgi:hypothetical protein